MCSANSTAFVHAIRGLSIKTGLNVVDNLWLSLRLCENGDDIRQKKAVHKRNEINGEWCLNYFLSPT